MADFAVVYQGADLRPETTRGTDPGTGNIRLNSIGLGQIKPTGQGEMFTPVGSKIATIVVPPGDEMCENQFEAWLTFNEARHLFNAGIKQVSPTTPGGATNTRDWTWSLTKSTRELMKTYTVIVGDGYRAQKYTFGHINGFSLDLSRKTSKMSGMFKGRRLQDDVAKGTNEVQTITITGSPDGGTFTLTFSGQTTANIAYNANAAAVQSALEALSNIEVGDVIVTGGALPGTPVVVTFAGQYAQTNVSLMTANDAGLTGGTDPEVAIAETTAGVAPTEDTPELCIPYNWDVYVSRTSFADLDTLEGVPTRYERAFKANFSLQPRFSYVWVMNSTENSFVNIVELPHVLTCQITFGSDDTDLLPLTDMRNGDPVYIRCKNIGDNIEGSFDRFLQIDFKGALIQPYDPTEEQGVLTKTWNFENIWDVTAGKSFEIKLRNDETS